MKILLLLFWSLSAFAKPEVHGHRGARGSRPENTMPGFIFALENGVDVLELDIAISADGVPVISHEPAMTPERCLDSAGKKLQGPIAINKLKYAEIKKYDCGKLPNARFPKQRQVAKTPMPRLEDLFSWVKISQMAAAKKVRFNIETKIYPGMPELTPEPAEFAEKIIEVVRKFDLVNRVIIQSFDDRTLLAVKKIEPKIQTALLTADNHLDFVGAVKSAKADILSPEQTWLLAEDVEKLHKAGIKVVPWTSNEEKDWARLIAMGVDGIISDYPKELIAYLKSH